MLEVEPPVVVVVVVEGSVEVLVDSLVGGAVGGFVEAGKVVATVDAVVTGVGSPLSWTLIPPTSVTMRLLVRNEISTEPVIVPTIPPE